LPAIPHIGKGREEDSAHADDLAHSFYAGLELFCALSLLSMQLA